VETRASREFAGVTPVMADISFADDEGGRGSAGGGPRGAGRVRVSTSSRALARERRGVERRIRHFLLSLVAARRLSQLGQATLHVENIIDDLEGEPEILTGHPDGLHLRGPGPGQLGAGAQGDADQGRRLVAMDELQRVPRHGLALGLDVHDLPAHHAPRSGGPGHGAHHLADHARVSGTGGDQLEGQGEERVAGQDGHGFAEHLVIGQPAPPVVVVVHGGQVVVDERVGVDQLERARRGDDRLGAAPHPLGPRDDQDGA
jgi:hypothetical protein